MNSACVYSGSYAGPSMVLKKVHIYSQNMHDLLSLNGKNHVLLYLSDKADAERRQRVSMDLLQFKM